MGHAGRYNTDHASLKRFVHECVHTVQQCACIGPELTQINARVNNAAKYYSKVSAGSTACL